MPSIKSRKRLHPGVNYFKNMRDLLAIFDRQFIQKTDRTLLANHYFKNIASDEKTQLEKHMADLFMKRSGNWKMGICEALTMFEDVQVDTLKDIIRRVLIACFRPSPNALCTTCELTAFIHGFLRTLRPAH